MHLHIPEEKNSIWINILAILAFIIIVLPWMLLMILTAIAVCLIVAMRWLFYPYKNITIKQVEHKLSSQFGKYGFIRKNNLLLLFCEGCFYSDDKMTSFKLMMDSGIDVNRKNRYGNTPLMALIGCFGRNFFGNRDYETIIKGLTEAGADINSQNKKGDTALHYFITSPICCIAINDFFKILLNYGADPFVRNNKGQSVYDILNLKTNKWHYYGWEEKTVAFLDIIKNNESTKVMEFEKLQQKFSVENEMTFGY